MNQFAIGTTFKTRGKHPRICTVVDILKTYNNANELVKVRYVATHELMGKIITDNDVCSTTIAMGHIDSAQLFFGKHQTSPVAAGLF